MIIITLKLRSKLSRWKTQLFILFFAALFFLPEEVFAQRRIIYVPEEYPTIQQAIDNANQGDVIQLSDGLYSMPENIEGWVTKNGASHDRGAIALKPGITLRGNVKDPSTILVQREFFSDGPHDGRPYYHYRYVLEADYADGATIEGLTIKGFDGIRVGAWYQTNNSTSITMRNNILEFIGDVAIYNHSLSHSNIVNNTFIKAGNVGIEGWGHASPLSKNNILLNCHFAFARNENSDLTNASYNDVYNCDLNYYQMDDLTGINGNISQDPQFVDISNRNFRLDNASPCKNAGEGGVGMGAYGLINPIKAYEHIYERMDTYQLGQTKRLIESYMVPYPPAQYYMAWVYDNALAICALLARGREEDIQRAKLLCDSLEWAQRHDFTFNDGRLRDGYWASALISDGNASVYDPNSSCGNMSWAIIALMNYYKNSNDPDTVFLNKIKQSAIDLGNFINTELRDTVNPGYYGGLYGWEPYQQRHLWKNTEHNTAVYCAFGLLYEVTNDNVWLERAIWAKEFLKSMWNAQDGMFYVGSLSDGITANTEPDEQAIDANAFPALSIGEPENYANSMNWAFQNCATSDDIFAGFDFNTDKDGVWFEGTSQASLAYLAQNRPERYRAYLGEVRLAQTNAPNTNSKAIVSASRDNLTTGIANFNYFSSPHIGATSWYLLSEYEYNPFWGIYVTENPKQPTLDPVVTPTATPTQLISGTKQANTSIWLNNTEIVPINSSTTWSYTLNLTEGNNYIYIVSKNAAGKQSMPITSTITLNATAPEVIITSPPE